MNTTTPDQLLQFCALFPATRSQLAGRSSEPLRTQVTPGQSFGDRHQPIDEPRALQAFDDLEALEITRYSHQLVLPGIWALRNNVTAYDASYLVLAEMLEAKLVTCDAALATVPRYEQWVDLVCSDAARIDQSAHTKSLSFNAFLGCSTRRAPGFRLVYSM